MPGSLFEQIDTNRFEPTEHSRGPWGPDLLHGGPVAALLAHQLRALAPDGGWLPARLTVDLMRPLSLVPLDVSPTILRAGRRAQLLSADCHVDGVLAARAALQLIATRDVPIPEDSPARQWAESVHHGPPEETPRMTPPSFVGDVAFHASSVEHRSTGHPLSGGGPASDWIRVAVDLLDATPLSPFERVVSAADFSNGLSASLPFEHYTFVNADLSVHIFRLPVDEWILVDAVTSASDGGVGLADARLSDRTGLLGHACQSLVVGSR